MQRVDRVDIEPATDDWIAVFAKWHFRVEAFLAVVFYFIAASILIVDVVARNLFQTTWLGSTSMVVMASVIAGFLGISLATANNSHLRIEALDFLIPKRFDRQARALGNLIAVGLYLLLAWYAVQLVQESYKWGDKVQDLSWPIWLFQIVLPWAFISTAIRHFLLILRPELSKTRVQGGPAK